MLYERNIPELQKYDVVVAGGGPAGCCAAIAAARLGAKTALIEKYGVLGGAMTVGGVPFPMSFHAFGDQVISGIGWEMILRLHKSGWAKIPDETRRTMHAVTMIHVDPVMAACEWDKMALDAGVELYFQCELVDAIAKNGYISHAIISSKQGLHAIQSKVFIDATGDGSLCAIAGAEFMIGSDVTGELQPGSQGFILDNFYIDEITKSDIDTLYMQAKKTNVLQNGDYWCEGRSPISHIFTSRGFNINHVYIDDLSINSMTQASLQGHERVARVLSWAKSSVHGAENIRGCALSPEPWLRESRRIIGDATISGEDYVNAVIYPDAICYSFYPVDIHKRLDKNEVTHVILDHGSISKGRVPTIPAGAVIVKNFQNLLTAGRCISGDRMAQSAYRVQATCMGIGQATGTIAALSCINSCSARSLSIATIKTSLLQQGAIVP